MNESMGASKEEEYVTQLRKETRKIYICARDLPHWSKRKITQITGLLKKKRLEEKKREPNSRTEGDFVKALKRKG